MLVPLIYRQTSHRKAKTRAGVRLGFIRRDGKRLGARWLIVDSEDIPLDDAEPVTAALGGVMISHHGAN